MDCMYRRVIHLTLAGYLAVLVYAGWMPLQFARGGAGAEFAEAIGEWSIGPGDLLRNGDVQLNILLFIPVGLFVAASRAGRWRSRWITLAAVGLAVAASLAIEGGQLFEASRFARLHDVAANAAGGLIGALAGQALFCARMRALWARAARRLQGKHEVIAAAAITMALFAGVLWQMSLSLSLARQQWSATVWHPRVGLALWPWHTWLIRWIAVFGALTLVLTAAHRDKSPGGSGVIRSAGIAVAVAMAVQTMHLFTPGTPPNMVAVALAAIAALGAALIAPRLRERRVELPVVVLACAAAVVVMVAHVVWLSTGGGTALPLWGLYKHEFAWGYYAMARRWAIMAGLSFLVAFYLSLTRARGLRWRMAVATTAVAALAAALELIRLIGFGRINIAGLIEYTMAAVAGTLLFALLWRILDRRVSNPAEIAYGGAERRGRPMD
jgi:hypothetical protein